ncbi:hypothetical protein ABPG74_012726 [Tetrahymena malaccensis]
MNNLNSLGKRFLQKSQILRKTLQNIIKNTSQIFISNDKAILNKIHSLATNKQDESQKTDKYLMVGGNTNQYYQSQTNREEMNELISLDKQLQLNNKKTRKQQTISSLSFNDLHFCEESLNLNNSDECQSLSISQLSDAKNKKSPYSSSLRRNSANLDTKRWKI